jgi:hypothetical protein
MPGARKDSTPVTVQTPHYEARIVSFGDISVEFGTALDDHDAAPAFKGLPDDACPCPHWGVVTAGSLGFRYRDHEETFGPGDVFYAPPGHIPVTPAGTEFISFSPTAELQDVFAAIAKNFSASQQ